MKKGVISNLLRKIRLIYYFDWIRFYVERFKNKRANKNFRIKHPNIKLPPDYLIYESFQINYSKYYTDSIESAKGLIDRFSKHIELKNKRILDWGCGPGRIIRHLPEVIGNGCEYYGTDYNKKSIDWCTQNLPGIRFNVNSLEAKLPYEDSFFDIIYGISIFTHLSEQMHYEWYNELIRVLKSNGIIYLTTQGSNFKTKMTNSELQKFNNGNLVTRGKVKEGHRTYSAFQPKEFMISLFQKTEILDHIEIKPTSRKWLPQDIWIAKKIN